MKPRQVVSIVAAALVVGVLGSCASTELAYHSFERESLRMVVRVAPDARVDADYFITIDPNDPVGTIISIGSSVVKASQVENAQRRMDVALRELDVQSIMEDEVGGYFQDVMEMRLTDSRRNASYYLSVEVREYGIEASGPGSSIEFVLSGSAELYDTATDDRIWRDRFSRSLRVSPSFFGLPSSAGNVVSAAMLSDLTEEQIADGIERVTREAAWEVGREFEDDLYRARRRR
ncbi:MAG: hypothetical protein ACOC2Q_05090 [Spirochaetota bacterium]